MKRALGAMAANWLRKPENQERIKRTARDVWGKFQQRREAAKLPAPAPRAHRASDPPSATPPPATMNEPYSLRAVGAGLLAMLAAVLLAGCAGGPPEDPTEPAYQRYWQCAYAAAMPYAADYSVSPRSAAARAQSACDNVYRAYRDARISYVRSVVPAQDRAMATTLGSQAARERYKMVTQRLTELVAEAR